MPVYESNASLEWRGDAMCGESRAAERARRLLKNDGLPWAEAKLHVMRECPGSFPGGKDLKPKKRSVVVHAGDFNTDTTLVQHLFHSNAVALSKLGIAYPSTSDEVQAHHYLAALVRHAPPYIGPT